MDTAGGERKEGGRATDQKTIWKNICGDGKRVGRGEGERAIKRTAGNLTSESFHYNSGGTREPALGGGSARNATNFLSCGGDKVGRGRSQGALTKGERDTAITRSKLSGGGESADKTLSTTH